MSKRNTRSVKPGIFDEANSAIDFMIGTLERGRKNPWARDVDCRIAKLRDAARVLRAAERVGEILFNEAMGEHVVLDVPSGERLLKAILTARRRAERGRK